MRNDITQKLEQIICRYQIAGVFPEFSKFVKAKELITQLLLSVSTNNQILLIASNKTDARIFNSHLYDNHKYSQLIVDFTQNFGVESARGYNCVIVVSYFGCHEISYELSKASIAHISLYDFFVETNLIIQHNYYDFIQGAYFDNYTGKVSPDFSIFRAECDIFYQRKCYESCKEALKSYYLKRIIFLLLHIRDFITAFQYMDEYIEKQYADFENIANAKQEIKNLLGEIKLALSEKSEHNSIMFWLDALEYGEDTQMPFLREVDDNATVFANAYAVTPYTQSSFKTIFTGKTVVDDRSYKVKNIDYENSPFIKVLTDSGIKFVATDILGYLDSNYHAKEPSFTTTTPTVNFWVAIEELLSSDSNIFVMVHETFCTHHPYYSAVSSGEKLYWRHIPTEICFMS